jgi:hypothetical protein
MCQKFSICTPGKAGLFMELVGEMKLWEKALVRRQLLGGSNVTTRFLTKKRKKDIYKPQCGIDGASTDTALIWPASNVTIVSAHKKTSFRDWVSQGPENYINILALF